MLKRRQPPCGLLLLLLSAALCLFGAVTPAAAQLTEGQVVEACAAARPPPAGQTYAIAHKGWTDVGWSVQHPFPGRRSGEVWVEVVVTASPTFSCTPVDGQGQPTGGAHQITAPVAGSLVLGEELACQPVSGMSTPIFGFPGAPCPFRQDAGFVTGTSAQAGPFPIVIEPFGADCTIFRPAVLSEGGLRHPIVIWGNGTGGKPTNYTAPHRAANHGFFVVAANTPMSGSGREMIACLDAILIEAANPASPFYRKLNPHRVGMMGYSQGGGGAMMAGRDPRVSATVLMNPYVGLQNGTQMSYASFQHAPMILFSGENDLQQAPVAQQLEIFRRAPVPVFYLTVRDVAHELTGYHTGGGVAFLRWQLMETPEMRPVFEGPSCTLCVDPAVFIAKKRMP